MRMSNIQKVVRLEVKASVGECMNTHCIVYKEFKGKWGKRKTKERGLLTELNQILKQRRRRPSEVKKALRSNRKELKRTWKNPHSLSLHDDSHAATCLR